MGVGQEEEEGVGGLDKRTKPQLVRSNRFTF